MNQSLFRGRRWVATRPCVLSPEGHRPVREADGRCPFPCVIRLAPATRSRMTYTLNLHEKLTSEAYSVHRESQSLCGRWSADSVAFQLFATLIAWRASAWSE
jgi:hypothetical protein